MSQLQRGLFCLTGLVWLSVLFSAFFEFAHSVNILCSDPIHYGTLELLIKQAEIPNNVCDLESECDLFVKIYVDGNFIGQSRTNMNSNKPLFNEYFKIESVTNVSTLRLIVMDEDKLENIGSDLQDENDEIFEIFLRIDEDILNENRNGKQMEVDGYSLKGIGAMGRLVFGIHWDNKFASCDFEQGDLHFAVKEAKIPWLMNSRNNLLKYQSIDLIGEVRVDGYLLGYTNRTMGKTHAVFDHSIFKAKNILNTFVITVRFFAANGSAFGRALDEQLCTVQATREDQRTEHDGWFECINNPQNSMNPMNTAASSASSMVANNKNSVDTNSDAMLMALLGRNIEPSAANNLVSPKVANDVEKIQVRIAYQWKAYYREIYQVNLLESRFEYVNLTNSLLDTHLRNVSLLQAGTLRNEGSNTISTYYARAYNQMETFTLKLKGAQPLNRIFELFAQQPIELELPLLNSTLRPPYKFTNLYKTVRMPLNCDAQNVCKTTSQKLYTISEVISIGSETLAQPHWYAVWLADIPLQIRLQFALNGEWHSNANGSGIIKPNLIKELLVKHGLNNNQITTKEDYVIIELTGLLKANYGLDSCLYIKCKSLDNSGFQTELFKVLH